LFWCIYFKVFKITKLECEESNSNVETKPKMETWVQTWRDLLGELLLPCLLHF
jgi:hypothetical protein